MYPCSVPLTCGGGIQRRVSTLARGGVVVRSGGRADHGWAGRALYNTRRCRSQSGATAVHCLAAVYRVAPYTVPMKVVQQQCCTLGRVRPAPLAHRPRMDMDRPARLL